MKKIKLALVCIAASLAFSAPALALDATITDTTITGGTTSVWNNSSAGQSIGNKVSVAIDQQDKGFTKEYNWSQADIQKQSATNGTSATTQNQKVTTFSNTLNTFGTINGTTVNERKTLDGSSSVSGVITKGSFKASITGHGGVKLKDKQGAPNSIGGQTGSYKKGVFEAGTQRHGMSFDITNTGKGFADNVGKVFENATVWVPQVGSDKGKGQQNKATIEFTKGFDGFTNTESNIQGTTTTTSITSGSFLN